jgi:hypothetical protein
MGVNDAFGLEDFDCYFEENKISEEHYPAALALRFAESPAGGGVGRRGRRTKGLARSRAFAPDTRPHPSGSCRACGGDAAPR